MLLLGCGLGDFYDEAPGQQRTRLDSVLIALPETVLRLRFSSDLAEREMATAALNHIATGNSDTSTNTRCRRAFITFFGRMCGWHFHFPFSISPRLNIYICTYIFLLLVMPTFLSYHRLSNCCSINSPQRKGIKCRRIANVRMAERSKAPDSRAKVSYLSQRGSIERSGPL